MSFEKFLNELNTLTDKQAQKIEQIKSHGLPIIIFGANWMARHINNLLNSFGVKVAGYAVDAEYFKPNQTFLDLPVYNFNELSRQPEKYVFVLGMNNDWLDGDRSWKFMQDEKIIRYALLDGGYKYADKEFISNEKAALEETFNLLEDELSRQTLIAYLRASITREPSEFFKVFRKGVYFNELTEQAKGGVYIDCGAYRGDTVERFVNWSGGNYKKIFAIEPDEENFAALKNFVHDKGYENVSLCNCGVWSEKGYLSFESFGAAYTAVSDTGNKTLAVEKIDDLAGNEQINFLKLTVEGSEFNALKGAKNILEKSIPTLTVSIYQKLDNLITIPKFIKNIYDGYKIYLRKHSRFSVDELILYAIPI